MKRLFNDWLPGLQQGQRKESESYSSSADFASERCITPELAFVLLMSESPARSFAVPDRPGDRKQQKGNKLDLVERQNLHDRTRMKQTQHTLWSCRIPAQQSGIIICRGRSQ